MVGSFLLHKITQKHGENFGLYRDDRLGVVKATPHKIGLGLRLGLLHKITQKHGENFGLYRDDGLGVIKATPHKIEIIKKDICSIFNNHGLKITIEANKKIVDFLDVTLNLSTQQYSTLRPQQIKPFTQNTRQHTSRDQQMPF